MKPTLERYKHVLRLASSTEIKDIKNELIGFCLLDKEYEWSLYLDKLKTQYKAKRKFMALCSELPLAKDKQSKNSSIQIASFSFFVKMGTQYIYLQNYYIQVKLF